MTKQTTVFLPPSAEGLPPGVLDSAGDGAARLDAMARTPYGRNFLTHALVQLARDGWLRTEPGEGFEAGRDRETPEPEDAPSVLPIGAKMEITVTHVPDPPELQREIARMRREWPGGRR